MTQKGFKAIKEVHEELAREKAKQTKLPSAWGFDHDGNRYESRAFFNVDMELKVETVRIGESE